MGLQIVGGKGEVGKVKKQCISDQLTEVIEDRVTQLSHKKFEIFFPANSRCIWRCWELTGTD